MYKRRKKIGTTTQHNTNDHDHPGAGIRFVRVKKIGFEDKGKEMKRINGQAHYIESNIVIIKRCVRMFLGTLVQTKGLFLEVV